MTEKILSSFLLLLVIMASACTTKPTVEDLNKVIINDYKNYESEQLGAYTFVKIERLSDKLITLRDKRTYAFYYLVLPYESEANDDEMFPYKASAFVLSQWIQFPKNEDINNVKVFMGQLIQMDRKELYNLCKNAPKQEGYGNKYVVMDKPVSIHDYSYKWGKNTKSWQRM